MKNKDKYKDEISTISHPDDMCNFFQKVGIVSNFRNCASLKNVDCFKCYKNYCEWLEADEMIIKIKYFDKDLEKIKKILVGDWIDLRSAERVEMKAGEYKLIRLGVGMILPTGYEALVLPRSSTPSKFGIIMANSVGVIDNSYSGNADEWKFPAVAIRDTVIEKNDRIAQFRIIENQPPFALVEVDELYGVSRGGIGSTGKR